MRFSLRVARDAARLAALLSLVVVVGCSKDETKPCVTCPTGDELVDQANDALGAILDSLLNAPDAPTAPSNIDFRTPERLYRDALATDPSNKDAHFGVAVTGLLTLTSNGEVNDAFAEWSHYLGEHVPFEVGSTGMKPLGVPIAFGSRHPLSLPFQIVPLTMVAHTRMLHDVPSPQISRIQAILRDLVIPKLQDAVTHISAIVSDPNYVFVVTPQMQGDPSATPVQIDVTDLFALRAAARLLLSACQVAVSYDLNMAAYDSTELQHSLTPGSGWMALRPDGATRMRSAKASLLDAITDVGNTITSLLNESDNQNDDVIKIDPNGLTRAEVDSIRVHLPDATAVLTEGITLEEDWDSDPVTPPVELTIHPGALFDTPIPDFKALLPDYTVRIERRPFRYDYFSSNLPADFDVTVETARTYSGSYYLSVFPQSGIYENYFGDELLRGPLTNIVNGYYKKAAGDPAWAGEFSGSAVFYGDLVVGTQTVSAFSYYTYTTVASEVYIPIIRWVAMSFETWDFPNPSFGGLLPFQTSDEFKSTFGITAATWTQEVPLDWTGGGYAAQHVGPMRP